MVAAQGAVDFVENTKRTAVPAFAFPATVGAVQHRRVAAAVEQQHALLALGHARLDGLHQRGRQHRAAGLVVHVHPPHHRQGGGADALGHVQPQVTTAGVAVCIGRAAVVPAFQRGCGRAKQHPGATLLAAVERQIPRGIAGALLLLVAGVVLFIDHDQLQLRHRGEHRHARAQHDACGAGVCGQPALEALCRRQTAVHGDDGVFPKAFTHTGFELGGEVDFRDQDQGLCRIVGLQHLCHSVQVDLGLAAAGAAKQQERAGMGGYLLQGLGLLRRQRRPGLDLQAVGGGGLLFQSPGQLDVVQVAQLRREGAERHLAQAALVILCGKGHQLTPTAVQRRQAFQGSGDVLEGLGRQIGGCQTVVPDHAEHLSPAQRYPHQRSRLQRHGAAVAQQIAHTTVCRRLHGDFDPMVCGGGHGAIKTVSRFSNFLDIRVKCLIFLIFRCDSDFLWITLLKTGCCGPGTLENQAFGQNAH